MYSVNNVDHSIIDIARDNCPLHESHFKKYFLGDLVLVQKNIEPIDIVSSQYQNSAYNSIDVSTLVASHAMKILEDTSYRNWTETTDDKLGLWARTLWRFCLTVPIGYITESNFVGSSSNNESWNPAAISLEEHLKGGRVYSRNSGRRLNPSYSSLSIFMRLFCDTFEYAGPMQGQAVVDAFDHNGGRENPIRQAFKRAAIKSLHEINQELLPYWWINCFREFGVIDEEASQKNAHASISFDNKGNQEEVNSKNLEDEPKLVIPPRAKESSSVDNATEGIGSDAVSKDLNEVSNLLCKSGINCKGALLYKVDDEFWVKYPKIKEDIAQGLGVEVDAAEQLLQNLDALEEDGGQVRVARFSIQPQGRAIGKMRLAKVDGELKRYLAGQYSSTDNNQDLVKLLG